jgi:2-keto-4-pentenoate hydratase/2-oxohepta-3-ene-1,7-dioic acid hydratase in catechol pathway
MKLATIKTQRGACVAVVRDGADGGHEYVDLHGVHPTLPATLRELLAIPGWMEIVRGVEATAKGVPSGQVQLLPPVPNPEKVICIGLNYADHAAETCAKVGAEPVVFCKFPTTIRGPGEPIVLPAASSEVDYEAELVVVIGREGRHIARNAAMDYVAGYTCGHDVSARDWQKHKPGGQWLLGKSFDTFAPLGPHLVTADAVPDPHKLSIQMRINGRTMQSSTTAQLIFRIDQLVSYLSQVTTLRPGDLIFTGTPPGVGMARTPPVFLKPGDTAEVIIEHIGTLTNPVVAEVGASQDATPNPQPSAVSQLAGPRI